MKKVTSLLLIMTMIFCASVPSYASATSWDTSDQANLQAIKNALTTGTSSVYGFLSNIKAALTYQNITVGQIAQNIYNALNSNGGSGTSHSAAYWLANINENLTTLMGWLDPSSSSSLQGVLNQILSMLSYTDAGGALKSWLIDIYQDGTNLPLIYAQVRSHNLKYADEFSWLSNNKSYKTVAYDNYGQSTLTTGTGSNFYDAMMRNNLTLIDQYSQLHNDLFYYTKGYPFNITNVSTAQNETFTPYSLGNAIIRYLQKTQDPVARLGYVLASPERIEAQDYAAANEQAVVDDFINPSGDATASTQDIGSIADLSAGYKQNFSSTASVTGIFDIFNSNNFGWFSSETAQQLDTTAPTRGSSYPTPLLDQQLEEINNSLGVTNAN